MERFSFSRFTLTIKAETPLFLPAYKGSTLRGGFGHAFRKVVCVFRDRPCGDCLLQEKCVYSWTFETPIPKEAQMMRKYTSAPHPFVIEPPADDGKNYQRGDDLSFGLILIGRAIDYLAYYIYTFEELGKMGIGRSKGKYQLTEVAEEGLALPAPTAPSPPAGEGEYLPRKKIIYRGEDKMLSGTNGPVRWPEIIGSLPPPRVRLSFLTPTRIKYENSLTNDLEFHVLFRNLLRRISLLSYFHCDYKLDDRGFKDLIEQARDVRTINQKLHWHDWERYSNRQETRMKMGGVMGEITYEGDLTPFWPYIRLGEYVHVGKGSSFGLGKYRTG